MHWLQTLHDETGEQSPLIGQLATIDVDSRPRVRSVVCRGIEPDGAVLVTSDARSRKNRQLRDAPIAEVCFWLEDQRVQWRLLGACLIEIDGERYERVWRKMSDSARALFAWPSSGEARADDDAFSDGLSAGETPPASYELLVLEPAEVDRLDLSSSPHARRLWHAPDWRGVDVNP